MFYQVKNHKDIILSWINTTMEIFFNIYNPKGNLKKILSDTFIISLLQVNLD
jgi:hypothetical protein